MTPEYPEDAIVNVVDGSIPAPAHTIYPDKGVGPILFGMTRDEVRAIWGEPNDVDLVTPTASYFDHGVTLGFLKYGLVSYSCELQDDSHTTFKTFTGKTVEGIGLGSTEEEVIAALGEPYERNNLRAPDAPPSSTSNLFLYYLFLNYDPPISMNFSMRRTNKSEEILRVTGISVHRR